MDLEERTQRDKILLDFLTSCATKAPEWDMCPIQFTTARDEVVRIISERDEAESKDKF